MKKLARIIQTEECDIENDEIKNVHECKAFPENKTVTLIKKDGKPFIGLSILFLCVSMKKSG